MRHTEFTQGRNYTDGVSVFKYWGTCPNSLRPYTFFDRADRMYQFTSAQAKEIKEYKP